MAFIFNGIKYDKMAKFFEGPIHSAIRASSLFHDVQQDREDAAELQTYFQEIKNFFVNGKGVQKGFAKEIYDLMPNDIQTLFNYQGLSQVKSGELFEQEIAQIIATVFNEIEQTNSYDVGTFQIGQELASPSVQFSYEELKKYLGKDVDSIITNLAEKVGQDAKGQDLFVLSGRQGKIDINVPKSSKILVYEGSPKIQRFYELLQGASFTAKNYLATNGIAYVKIGNTSSLRMYTSILSFLNLGYSDDEVKKVFFAARNSRAINHKRHLRFIYELVGPGLKYNGVDLGTAKFLIVNERNGSGITVLSTKDLIYQVIGESERQTKDLSSNYAATHLKITFSNDGIS